MNRFPFAAAPVAPVASVGTSDEKPAVAPALVVTSAHAPIVESAPAQPGRCGLFGRVHNR